MLEDVQTILTRALFVMVAVLVIATLVFDLLAFGPAAHALDPSLPYFNRIGW